MVRRLLWARPNHRRKLRHESGDGGLMRGSIYIDAESPAGSMGRALQGIRGKSSLQAGAINILRSASEAQICTFLLSCKLLKYVF